MLVCQFIAINCGFLVATIVVSNDINEDVMISLKEQKHCIDSFGIGERILLLIHWTCNSRHQSGDLPSSTSTGDGVGLYVCYFT